MATLPSKDFMKCFPERPDCLLAYLMRQIRQPM